MNGCGVDIVVDLVGGDWFIDLLCLFVVGGWLLVIGFIGGEIFIVKVNCFLFNNIDVVGVGWGVWLLIYFDVLV